MNTKNLNRIQSRLKCHLKENNKNIDCKFKTTSDCRVILRTKLFGPVAYS